MKACKKNILLHFIKFVSTHVFQATIKARVNAIVVAVMLCYILHIHERYSIKNLKNQQII